MSQKEKRALGFPSQGLNRQKRVVVIDDQSSSRNLISRIIESIDDSIKVDAYQDPRSAISALKTIRPSLVVTDYRMPEMDGIQVVRSLREAESTAHTPIVMITICDNKGTRKQALEAGATDFLTKPVNHDECRARCRNLLALDGYQSLLVEHIALLTARIQSLSVLTSAAGLTTADCHRAQSPVLGQHVAIEYGDLYELTSTVAAIERLLRPLQGKINSLESSLERPLCGQERSGRNYLEKLLPLSVPSITELEG